MKTGKIGNIRFSCTRCGKCCSLEVPVVLSDIELWVKRGRYDIISNIAVSYTHLTLPTTERV